MKTHKTIAGNTYCVSSPNGGTVTDASGSLNKPVEAGDQVHVTAPSGELYCDDDAATIVKANFKCALAALGLLGGGETSGLPAGYTRVEYLESTGTQYLKTNVLLHSISRVSAEIYTLNIDSPAYGYYQDRHPSHRVVHANKEGFYVTCGGQQTRKVYTQSGWIRFENSASGFYINSILIHSYGNVTPFTTAGVSYIFTSNTQTNEPRIPLGCLRMKDFRIDEDGKALCSLIPALDRTGSPCMFDTVTRKPYYNAGTGDFLYPGKEQTATTYSLRRPRMYAQMTPHGIRRLYHVPRGYNGTPEEYAAENGFKILVETPAPEEGYWAPVWHDREDCIELEWVETEPPAEELLTDK